METGGGGVVETTGDWCRYSGNRWGCGSRMEMGLVILMQVAADGSWCRGGAEVSGMRLDRADILQLLGNL